MNDASAKLLQLAAQSKKGRMDALTRKHCADLVVEVLRSGQELTDTDFSSFNEIQSEALAEAVNSVWPDLPGGRRRSFKRYVHKPATDREIRRLALLVAATVESDGETAFEWLQLLLPRDRAHYSKEVRHSLSSILFGGKIAGFERLLTANNDGQEVLRILSTLWDIGKEAAGSSMVARARLALTLISAGADGDVLNEAELQSRQWPTVLQQHFANELKLIKSRIQQSGSSTRPDYSATAPPQPQNGDTPLELKPAPVVAGATETDCLSLIEAYIKKKRDDLSLLVLLESQIRELVSERDCALSARQSLERTVGELNSELSRMQEDRNKELRQLNELNAALKSDISTLRVAFEGERSGLRQQISANANGRVEEFRNRIGGVLSRLILDLPDKDAPMTRELGTAVLVQCHQLVDALRELEVPITRRSRIK